MTGHPDPQKLSRDELVAYFDAGGDISERLPMVGDSALPGGRPGPRVHAGHRALP